MAAAHRLVSCAVVVLLLLTGLLAQNYFKKGTFVQSSARRAASHEHIGGGTNDPCGLPRLRARAALLAAVVADAASMPWEWFYNTVLSQC